MTRAWLGTALLAASWLLGLHYFSPAQPVAWILAIAGAIYLLQSTPVRWPGRGQQGLALVLALPAIWIFTFPYRAIPILFAGGLGLQIVPMPRAWPRQLGRGAVVASLLLSVQALALWGYESLTARSHDLPWPLTHAVGIVLNMVGVDTGITGNSLGLRCTGDLLPFHGTWELLIDPATFCFVIGGLMFIALNATASPTAQPPVPTWIRDAARLLLVTAAWIPIRTALLFAAIMQQALRADINHLPNIGDLLLHTWGHLGMLAILAWFVARWVPGPVPSRDESGPDPLAVAREGSLPCRTWIYPMMVVVGTAIFGTLMLWNPVGTRKAGRIMVVERHSTWEPTTEPYGTTIYGEAGSYNYAAAYAYCQQYYTMDRLLESDPIDDATLRNCDVLVIKTPTARYTLDEVDAVVRFVQRGGALLLIGDHTNVFNMNTYLNDIARHFGFTFRNDLLFRIGDPYKQRFDPPSMSHPILQHVPSMYFAVSCSIDPSSSRGTMVIRNTGLWSLPPAYHESNYHPQAEFRTPMQYGAWCQLWATSHGAGRVLGFADSTLFSNFCVFQPGKAELLIGMLEWLNHTSVHDRIGWQWGLLVLVAITGLGCVVAGCYFGWRQGMPWPILASALLLGGSVVGAAIPRMHQAAMPQPAKHDPLPHVVIDRTWSDVPLFTGAFSDDENRIGYGMLEQWIPRIGNSISRRTGDASFQGDGLVILCPTRSINRQRLDRLVDYVAQGGQVLVLDSPDNEGSTANSILAPFGLASQRNQIHNPEGKLWVPTPAPSAADHKTPAAGHDAQAPTTNDRTAATDAGSGPPPAESLTTGSAGPHPAGLELPLQRACTITGGEPLATWEGIPVAARARHGDGTVVAIGFGSLFCDETMGTHWLPEPEPGTLEIYDVLYTLLRMALPAREIR